MQLARMSEKNEQREEVPAYVEPVNESYLNFQAMLPNSESFKNQKLQLTD